MTTSILSLNRFKDIAIGSFIPQSQIEAIELHNERKARKTVHTYVLVLREYVVVVDLVLNIPVQISMLNCDHAKMAKKRIQEKNLENSSNDLLIEEKTRNIN